MAEDLEPIGILGWGARYSPNLHPAHVAILVRREAGRLMREGHLGYTKLRVTWRNTETWPVVEIRIKGESPAVYHPKPEGGFVLRVNQALTRKMSLIRRLAEQYLDPSSYYDPCPRPYSVSIEFDEVPGAPFPDTPAEIKEASKNDLLRGPLRPVKKSPRAIHPT